MMDLLATDLAVANKAVEVSSSPTALATLLSASGSQAAWPGTRQLQHIPFQDIVAAIELAGIAGVGQAGVKLYRAWITANAGAPHLFAAWFNLGVALAALGDRTAAAQAYNNALALRPDFHPASINLGLSLEALGQKERALRAWESATQSNEDRTGLLNQRARLLESLGRLAEAENILRNSLLTEPNQPDAVQHWVHLRQKMCAWPILEPLPGLAESALLVMSGPLSALALTDEVGVQHKAAAAWIERKTVPVPRRLAPAESYGHERIRIGYLSSDFCRHAMSFLVAELLERHDRTRFEVFGYCSSPEDGSDIRNRVISAFDHHRIIRDLSDEAAAQAVQADEIDVLIDLNGLTAGSRLQILRYRPARIQATYLGFVGPVPLPELDYLLCDDFVVPPQQSAAYQPTPLPLSSLYQANDSKRSLGRPMSRQDAGLPSDRFVLCCFSNHYKITETIFSAWMEILQATNKTVLWLSADNDHSHANLRQAATRAGIDPGRLIFAGRTDPDTYMQRLALADLFLDTFPYNAGTIASDAIRMRLPIVTLCGRSFASRMAGSLLNTLGTETGVTTNISDYVSVATNLITDHHQYVAYKAAFNDEAWRTTIGDVGKFTAAFESAIDACVSAAAEPCGKPCGNPA